MANFFSRLFNSEKKDTTYNGTKPVTSLSQVQGGPEYYQTLIDRMAGRGVGYGDSYTSYANPQVAALHNNYTGYELPELKSELTANGRRSGSAGFQQISRSMQDQADKENSILAQLMQRNAEAGHTDVNNAITGVGNYAQNEADLVGKRANFDYADNTRQVEEANARRANESKGLQAAGQAGVMLAAAPFTGGASLGMGNFSNPFAGSAPGTGFNPSTMSTMPYGYNMGNGGGSVASRVGQRGGYR